MFVKENVVSLREYLITVVETKTPSFLSTVAAKTTQILVRLTLRSSVVDFRTIIVDEKMQKRF